MVRLAVDDCGRQYKGRWLVALCPSLPLPLPHPTLSHTLPTLLNNIGKVANIIRVDSRLDNNIHIIELDLFVRRVKISHPTALDVVSLACVTDWGGLVFGDYV